MLLPQPRRDYSRDAPTALEGSSSALTNLLSNLDSLVSDGNRNVQSSIDDIREKRGDAEMIALPSQQEIQETMERTLAALQEKMQGKIKMKTSSGVTKSQDSAAADATYIRYNVNSEAAGYHKSTQQRVIKMVEAQVDPMEPAKHKIRKEEKGAGSPPAPILHSPARKLSKEEAAEWKIPTAYSNWKNEKGFIIPLDKRLATDGHAQALAANGVNDKFADFAEALYTSERKAAEDIRVRNNIRKQMALREREEREEELKKLAAQARALRAEVQHQPPSLPSMDGPTNMRGQQQLPSWMTDGNVPPPAAPGTTVEGIDGEEGQAMDGSEGAAPQPFVTEEERIAFQEQERERFKKKKELERQLRLEARNKGGRNREAERDISEKVALGQYTGGGQLEGESQFDSRLFNRSEGMSAGFVADDEDSAYSKPLFNREGAQSIYRPRADANDMYGNVEEQLQKLKELNRFQPAKGFKGAEVTKEAVGGRSGPVQFEREGDKEKKKEMEARKIAREKEEEGDDPFGIADLVPKKKSRFDE
jgi:SNW domain-containing protein 1